MNRVSNSLLSKQSQLLKFSKRLQKKVSTGEFSQLPARKKEVLTGRVARLHRQLMDRMPDFRMSHAFALSTLVLGLAGGTAVAQTPAFAPPIEFPYGIDTYTGQGYLVDIDYADLDGDLDAVIVDTASSYYLRSFRYFENTGTPTAPAFTNPASNPFDPETLETFAFFDLVDLDNDGDTDLLYISYDYVNYSPFLGYRENTGTPTAPAFGATQSNPFGFVVDSAMVSPVTVDLDNDGDKDLLINDFDGQFLYYENTGTAALPAFGAPVTNPFGLTSVNYLGFSDVADLDGDGDLDLTVSQYAYGPSDSAFVYFENTTPVGIADPVTGSGELDWQLYPNPATSRSGRTSFTVKIPPVPGLASIDFELINGIGQTMQEATWQMEPSG